jgi:hypothetical protein
VIDLPLPPKYALAEASRPVVITGEGGGDFFGGGTAARVVVALAQAPGTPPGVLYARSHERFVERLGAIFRRGDALAAYAYDYCGALLGAYPGDLLRKLFYVNAHDRLAGMVLPQSYFPARMFGLTVRHPFASLGVYESAFRLPDHRKFVHPAHWIVLTQLYGLQLPAALVERRTRPRVPMAGYLAGLLPAEADFPALRETELFRDEILDLAADPATRESEPVLVYAFATLEAWLDSRGPAESAMRLPPLMGTA